MQTHDQLHNRIAVSIVVSVAAAAIIHVGITMVESRRYYKQVTRVRMLVDSLHWRRPPDVPADQWREAVDWTSNVICQDFFSPQPGEYESLCRIATELEQKVASDVDFCTLQWVWDQCEVANGGRESFAIRFRRIKLLTKGPITDARLEEIWSLDRCIGLDLGNTEITDESVTYLKSLKQLETLDISGTGISEEAATALERALPSCRIIR